MLFNIYIKLLADGIWQAQDHQYMDYIYIPVYIFILGYIGDVVEVLFQDV